MLNKTKIKIGLDARAIFAPVHRGIGKTLLDLYRRIPLLEPLWEFYLFYIPRITSNIDSIILDCKNIKRIAIAINGYWRLHNWEKIWSCISLPIAVLMNNISLLHCPSHTYTFPYYTPCPKVITIHDIIALKMEVGLSQKKIRTLSRNIRHSLKTAQKIITVSEYSKKDILDTFGMQYEKKIEVIYWAPEDNCRPLQVDTSLMSVKNKYSINSPYIFAFGDIFPRRNIPRLLESFSIFTKKIKKEVWLVIAGPPEFNKVWQNFKSLIRDLGIEEKVILTGFIPEEDIPFLLSGAEFLVYPSLYEGFGLPPLDAMACDCPVIASNVTSIPEVVGDAAILVNPYDVNEIADAMVNLFGNSQLRKELIEKGRERIKHFSWDKTARETLQVYREALGM